MKAYKAKSNSPRGVSGCFRYAICSSMRKDETEKTSPNGDILMRGTNASCCLNELGGKRKMKLIPHVPQLPHAPQLPRTSGAPC